MSHPCAAGSSNASRERSGHDLTKMALNSSRLVFRALEFPNQTFLDFRRVPLTLSNPADVGAVNPEMACDSAVYPAKRIDVTAQFLKHYRVVFYWHCTHRAGAHL